MNIKRFIDSARLIYCVSSRRFLGALNLVLISFSASIYADVNSVISTPSSFNIAIKDAAKMNEPPPVCRGLYSNEILTRVSGTGSALAIGTTSVHITMGRRFI